MNNLPLLNDLRVFMLVARRAGFAAVAEELGVSPAFVSKRIALLEQTLNVVLLHRTTRRVTITEEGERIYEWAQRILQDVGQMMDELSDVRQVPQGMLRIISSFGFGRQVVAPALSALAKAYPQLELRFDVEDRLVDLVNEGVDLDIRIGDDIAPLKSPAHCRLIMEKLSISGVSMGRGLLCVPGGMLAKTLPVVI